MKQPDLYYFEAIKMMSQAWSTSTENTRLRLHNKIYKACDVILWLQNSIDRLFHGISVNYTNSTDMQGSVRILRQVLFDIRAENSNLAKSLGEKRNHAMYQNGNPHRGLLSLQN